MKRGKKLYSQNRSSLAGRLYAGGSIRDMPLFDMQFRWWRLRVPL